MFDSVPIIVNYDLIFTIIQYFQEVPGHFDSKQEFISCATVSASIVVYGTSKGRIFINSINGKQKRIYKAHDRHINDIYLDSQASVIARSVCCVSCFSFYIHLLPY